MAAVLGCGHAVLARQRPRPCIQYCSPPPQTMSQGQKSCRYSLQSPVRGGLARDTTRVPTAKRQLEATPENDPLLGTRARLTRTDAQRSGVEEGERAYKTGRRHPRPGPYKCRDTSLPEPKVDGQEKIPAVRQLRKRRIEGDNDADERGLKRARLTQKNLARFTKMARKGTRKRSAPASAPPDSTVSKASSKASSKSISTTSSGFAIQAYENGILNCSSSKPPENLEDIYKRYAQFRRTASPTEYEYERYVDRVEGGYNEATMVVEVSQRLLKDYDDKGNTRPDFVEGLQMEEYRPFPVHKDINGAVLYKDNPRSSTLPHLAGEWKGYGKDMNKARLQSAYDGAALVYARNQALSYLERPDPSGFAEITTFTTDGITLNHFAHYAALPEEVGTVEYHQYPVRSINLIDSRQGLSDGRRGLRNEQEHARELSYALRDQLKEHWKQRRGGLPPIAEKALLTDLDKIPNEPLPAQESSAYPDDDVETAKFTQHKRTSRKAPRARGTNDESGYKFIDRSCYAPTPPRSSEGRRRSARLSNRERSSDEKRGDVEGRLKL